MLFFVFLLVFGGYIVLQYRHIYQREHEILTSSYARQLNHDISSMESYIKNLYGNNTHYQVLKRPQNTESQWMLATYFLNNTLSGKADNLDYFGGVFYYDADWDSLRSEFSRYPYASDDYRLNQAIKQEARLHAGDRMLHKGIISHEGETYLLYMLGDRGRILGYLINLTRYFDLQEKMQLIIFDAEGNLLVNQGDTLLDEQAAMAEIKENASRTGLTYMISQEDVGEQGLKLLVIHQDENLAFWSKPEMWLLCILMPLVAFIALWYVYRLVKRLIYQPIDYFAHRLMEMKKGTSPENLRENGRGEQLEEIRLINEKLDELILEMSRLEQDKYIKEKEANAALLQYYQLQVRPHFFLNCLNIVASLINEEDMDTVKTMILSVSKHFRYVFQDSDSLVTLAEELEEVNAYCNIYIITSATPILLQVQISEEVGSYQVPILCIQTFVENAIKYAISRDRVLSITIKADLIQHVKETYVRIHIMDNGEGYNPAQLEQLNKPVTEFQYHSKQVGIDNVKYRIFLLYGAKATLYFYNSPGGGAVAELLLPLERNEYFNC